ncbi:integral membrane sensor signal transduction histidine kinase [Desulfarculus baarsii DSM 2075]|uniref:histidine kinase n=1 Tax=Desulfarculus baarsii (strain ATCC 33931 / DSM 2075 / LMG 7858 / VKM B-1802 / 2st14) TaxID=644282 RepID=E1QDQ4_DESB2|nr:HAMP domain-containing sensor histidine kinase [Desulfarculus baarsii]ADK83690.1 integral membrane sensor signal transduction histidine kinase [Desulfarculus baarsii DSM 2075]
MTSLTPEMFDCPSPIGDPVHDRQTADNIRALMNRPLISLRLQIYLGFLAAFIMAAGVAASMVYNFHRMERSTRFLEIVSDYVMEVEQARRYEKNYLLYGRGLDEALEHIFTAEQILSRNAGELAAVMGGDWSQVMSPKLMSYQGLLEKLAALKNAPPAPEAELARHDLQKRMRAEGQGLVSDASALLGGERAALAEANRNARRVLFYALALLLLALVANAYLLGTRMLRAIKHLGEHAASIAMGDFRPITPTRFYRDEFTDLAVSINTMVEELQHREAVLIQSHKMRAVGTLTAGVAHELNNPLNNITITAHVLQEDYDSLDDAERREMIGDVVAEANRARKIISNLLDFARESSSRIEPLDLPSLLRETIYLASNQIKLSGIKIELQASDNLPRVHGDSQQLRQVFLNLILNAIDASAKGGKIQVMLAPADEPHYVAVKVIDFGAGIPEHILPSVFDPFFTTKARYKGTGLGLSVSQGIVAKHGGRIMVYSQPGKGATFTVILPVTTIPAQLDKPDAAGA